MAIIAPDDAICYDGLRTRSLAGAVTAETTENAIHRGHGIFKPFFSPPATVSASTRAVNRTLFSEKLRSGDDDLTAQDRAVAKLQPVGLVRAGVTG